MAWNEPGGSGDKDPWGNRKNEQGPPDLDELFKQLQKKFAGLFGGKKMGGSGRSGSGGGIGLGFIAAIVLVIWALSGIYIVDTGTKGVVLQFGAFKQIIEPGPHWYPRFIQTVDIVNVDQSRSERIGTTPSEALMLTKDENIVDILMEVQFKVRDPKNYLFAVQDPVATLRQAAESALREVVGTSTMDFVLTTGRSQVANETESLTQKILDRYKTGLLVTQVNLQHSDPPEQVKAAFLDASSAREDKVRFINEAQAYSNDILPKARGQAVRLIQEAEAYRAQVVQRAEGETVRFKKVLTEYRKAPDVTRNRMYLDTIEEVLGNTNKVLLDTKQGNSLMYLPIDKLIQKNAGSQTIQTAPNTSSFGSKQSETASKRDRSRDRNRGER
ncbi:MAG: FtsH protease activity modulator HflK [Proteobacteria bacterium]|jgi:modulator of FtsH protease HflK|nr:FtsH protease activity modulator HflK [Pseudomonadota bacterium]MCG6935327.1 FtsH protease activity modulator HflK [Pseudomonadota bacterium]